MDKQNLWPLVIYHSADLDGISSAAQIYIHLNSKCELCGMDYGEKFDWTKVFNKLKRTVYLVDFSFPIKEMERLNKETDLIYIDHHKSAIDEIVKNRILIKDGRQDTKYAACELTWKYLNSDKQQEQMPKAIKYLGIFDSWRNDDKDLWNNTIMPFEFGCLSLKELKDPTNPLWNNLIHTNKKDLLSILSNNDKLITKIIDRGRVILDYKKEVDAKICDRAAFDYTLNIDNKTYKTVCVNAGGTGSQTFDSVYNDKKYDIMISFYINKRNKWSYSFYSTKPHIDCGKIAKEIAGSRGGGHKGAAGCELDYLIFNK